MYATGVSAAEQDAYTGLQALDQEPYYWEEIRPRIVLGAVLVGAGGVGLAATGVWAVATDGGAQVGMTLSL